MHFKGKNILFLDWETFYDTKNGYGLKELSVTEYIRDPRFHAHGLAYRWQHEGISHWIGGEHTICGWIGAIDWPNTVIVAHNVRFDGAILAWRYGVKPFMWFDTVGLAKAVLGGNVSGYHLKGLAEYLGLQPKGELKWDGVLALTDSQEAEMAEYCKGDVDICAGIYGKLIGQFPESQCGVIDWTIRAFVEPRLVLDAAVLEKGVRDEKTRREGAISRAIPEIHLYRAKIEREWYDSFKTHKVPFAEPKTGLKEAKEVLASNKQFAELLASRGLKVPTKTSSRTGQQIPAFSKTDDGLVQLNSIAPDLYAARIASKANLLETRGESLLAVARTGPFPFDVGFSGALQTHRYAGGSGAGGNPQNFTRKSFLREAVCAPAGNHLCVGDFTAVELRVLAWIAKELRLINKLVNDEDVYADFASKLYGRSVSKRDPERAFGKEAILGLGYGMGADKFQMRVKTVLKQEISDDEAWKTVNLYRTTYFNVPKLWEACSTLIPLIASGGIGCLYFAPFLRVRKNEIILPSGLSIRYPNLRPTITEGKRGPRTEWVYDVYHKKYEAETTRLYGGKMVENICQALAGELCKEAIARAEEHGLVCVGQVHDEIIALSPSEDTENGMRILRTAMEQSPPWWPQLRLVAEVGHGRNWNEAKS